MIVHETVRHGLTWVLTQIATAKVHFGFVNGKGSVRHTLLQRKVIHASPSGCTTTIVEIKCVSGTSNIPSWYKSARNDQICANDTTLRFTNGQRVVSQRLPTSDELCAEDDETQTLAIVGPSSRRSFSCCLRSVLRRTYLRDPARGCLPMSTQVRALDPLRLQQGDGQQERPENRGTFCFRLHHHHHHRWGMTRGALPSTHAPTVL